MSFSPLSLLTYLISCYNVCNIFDTGGECIEFDYASPDTVLVISDAVLAVKHLSIFYTDELFRSYSMM